MGTESIAKNLINIAEGDNISKEDFENILASIPSDIKERNKNLILYIIRKNNIKILEYEKIIAKLKIKIALVKKYIKKLDTEVNDKIIVYKSAAHAISGDDLYCKDMGDIDLFFVNKEGIKQLYEVNFVPIREWNLSRFYELTFKNNSYPYVTFDIHWKFWLVESRTIKKDRRRETLKLPGFDNIEKFSDRYYSYLIALECFRNLNYDSFSIFLFRNFYKEDMPEKDNFLKSTIIIMKVKSGLIQTEHLEESEIRVLNEYNKIERNKGNSLKYFFKVFYIIKWFANI
ncbi:MAG: hypothetical protein CL587_17345 [Alteromonadaceae bacterium]|nr:hypothetical protein [Alteromonadaceae bacterium]